MHAFLSVMVFKVFTAVPFLLLMKKCYTVNGAVCDAGVKSWVVKREGEQGTTGRDRQGDALGCCGADRGHEGREVEYV
jgi:hypothetical protein